MKWRNGSQLHFSSARKYLPPSRSRFPYDNVVFSGGGGNKYNNCSSATAAGHKTVFDYEAFQIDGDGTMSFSRVTGGGGLKAGDFCVDVATVTPDLRIMMAVFCAAAADGVEEGIMEIRPPTIGLAAAELPTSAATLLASLLVSVAVAKPATIFQCTL